MTCVGRKMGSGDEGSKSQAVRGSCKQTVAMYIRNLGTRWIPNIMGKKHLDVHLIHIKMAPQTKPHLKALHFP